MVVIDSDGYEENYVLISSSHCIIFNKIEALKNAVFLVKFLPCRCRSQPQVFFYFSVVGRVALGQYYYQIIHNTVVLHKDGYHVRYGVRAL